jgi:hypothetical protein
MTYLQESNEQVFVAPMNNWAQLAHWLDPESLPQMPLLRPAIHAIYGPTELLLYGVRFLILSFDWAASTFTYVELPSILKASGLSSDRFFEACVLAGFDGVGSTVLDGSSLPLTSTVSSSGAGNSSPAPTATDSFKQYIDARASGAADISILLGPDTPRLTNFNKNCAVIRLSLIFDLKGDTRPFARDVLSQMSAIRGIPGFNAMMPEAIYWLLTSGTISPQVINVFLSGAMVETTPLVDSPSYHKVLDDLLEMRSRTLSLLAAAMPSHLLTKDVFTLRWYEQDKPSVPMPHAQFKGFSRTCGARWFISSAEIASELKRREIIPATQTSLQQTAPSTILHNLSLPFVLSTLENNKNVTPSPPEKGVITPGYELYASVIGLTLEIYQYVAFGRALTDFGKTLKEMSPVHAAESFIFLELFRAGHIHGQPLHPSTPLSENDPELSLISRVFSMISMELTEKWSGPIDRELMAFNSLLRATYRTARNLMEMALVSITQAGRIAPSLEYPVISRLLPFNQESNTCLGVVVTSFLLEERTDFMQRFSKIPTLKQDLQRGYAFWKDVVKAIGILQTSNQPSLKALLTPELVALLASSSERLASSFSTL